MIRVASTHLLGSKPGESRYVLVMEDERRIYRADVTVEADDALGHANAMLEGWSEIKSRIHSKIEADVSQET